MGMDYKTPVKRSNIVGVSWCCGSHCWLVFVLWCGYCSASFESFVLRHLVITPSATLRNYLLLDNICCLSNVSTVSTYVR